MQFLIKWLQVKGESDEWRGFYIQITKVLRSTFLDLNIKPSLYSIADAI